MKTHNEATADVVKAAEEVMRAMNRDLFLGNAERNMTEAEASQMADKLTDVLPEVFGLERAGEFAKRGVALRRAGERLQAALNSLHDTRQG